MDLRDLLRLGHASDHALDTATGANSPRLSEPPSYLGNQGIRFSSGHTLAQDILNGGRRRFRERLQGPSPGAGRCRPCAGVRAFPQLRLGLPHQGSREFFTQAFAKNVFHRAERLFREISRLVLPEPHPYITPKQRLGR